MTQSLPDAARTEAVLYTLKDAVYTGYNEARVATQAALETADAAMGVTSVTARVDGHEVAKISLVRSKPKATVVNPVALLTWAEEHYPAAVIRTINPEWQKRLLEAATKAGAPVDVATGEVIPGVQVADAGTSTHQVRMTKTGRAVIGDAWRRGELTDVVTRALMPGTEA